jgi:methylthioribose-1-phosphate isomerase
VRVLTHCNAGWLATVDWGTATSPVYQAWDAGIPLHVWVDETRPRLQGARLTAWEMAGHGVPHRVVPDGAAAWLMRTGQVDLVIVGTDRTTASGDVANKIGTYPLALAASDNGVPFFVAAPSPSIDWELSDGADIPIEERAAEEVTEVQGADADGSVRAVRIANPGSDAANFAFDVTPARLVTGIVTERGVCPASREGLAALFRAPDAGAASSGSAGSSPAEGSGPRETGEGTGPGDATEPPVRG